MAYTVRNSNNVVVATVADNAIDTTTDLTLIGKNYNGYGQKLNENLIYLLENFTKTSAPTKPIKGQLWYDATTNDLKIYNGSSFVAAIKAASSLTVSSTITVTGNANVGNLGTTGLITATGNISGGNLTTAGVLSVTGNANVGNLGTTGLITATGNISGGNLTTGGVLSVTGNANVGNLGTTGLITATGNVSGGNLTTTGVVSATGNVSGGNLTTTGVVSATGNVSGGNLTTTGVVSATGNVSGGNLTTAGVLSVTGNANVGNLGTTTAVITTGNITTINSGTMQNGNSNVKITANSNVTINVTAANSYTFATGSFAPNGNAAQQLGLTGARWSNIWGVSSSALYADLAEKYWSDGNYEAGTVVKIGGNREITICDDDCSKDVFGCISQNPAYLMNDNNFENYQPVVLHGRSIVKIIGKVNKGDRLVSAGNGCARRGLPEELKYQTEIGRALSDKNYDEVAFIEAFISTK